MALITDQSTFFNTTGSLAWKGQYSGSQGSEDFIGNFVDGGVYEPTAQLVRFNPSTLVTRGFNTYFKIQGFNASTSSYEVWFSTGVPLLIPPSGHTLSNIEVVTSWIDR